MYKIAIPGVERHVPRLILIARERYADSIDMKRTLIGLTILILVVVTVHSQELGGRTLVNGETAPLVFVSLRGAQADRIETRDAAIALLRENRRRLETVAPGGMWRVDSAAQTLVGYYSGGAAVLGYRLLIKEFGTGTNPVTVDRGDLIRGTGGETVGLAPWELPERPEPVLVDGDTIEWQEIDPLLQYSRYFTPHRIEDAATGTPITEDEATMWRRSGTALRTLKSVAGARYWYVAIETTEAIADGTGYVLRVYDNRDAAGPMGEVVILIDGTSGPVILRGADGTTQLTGEYVRNERVLEVEMRRVDLESFVENVFDSEASFDVATTRRVDTRAERYSIGTVYFRDVVR